MTAELEMPKAFKTLISAMYWPPMAPMPMEHLLISDALDALFPEEKIVAKQYIDELINPRHSDAAIKLAWNRTSPGFAIIDDAGYRRFLALVSKIIGDSSGI